eukprot:1911827-Rhodomonas_salina.2
MSSSRADFEFQERVGRGASSVVFKAVRPHFLSFLNFRALSSSDSAYTLSPDSDSVRMTERSRLPDVFYQCSVVVLQVRKADGRVYCIKEIDMAAVVPEVASPDRPSHSQSHVQF